MDLRLDTAQLGTAMVVGVGGEIDVYSAPVLRDKLSELVASGQHDLVVDLNEVSFMDSTGLGVLVGTLKKIRTHEGSMDIVCARPRLLKIFQITGLAKVFSIYDTREAALLGRS
ncbi:MAG TPA: anti-sigma factor antagonist [Marmoricola sp.]|nr:anti-sigma factor antagonist [Marmoricola sp.]